MLRIVPCAVQRFLLVIYFIYSSVYAHIFLISKKIQNREIESS